MFDAVVQAILSVWNVFWIGILNLIAGLLPTINNPNINFITALDAMLQFGMQLSFIIPWPTIFTGLLIMATLQFGLMIIKLAMWIAGLARGGH